ncbi:LLM class flavin-dependent oxidoreductase [Dankookia rubra]|uniref:LLM class flavin-dependent oxidoreductase n=1 Tax=Dankookia rubra TaxID=1442381 RepID=A0A4R5QCH1_9PROT|nr:LLM class flavin-dependent oxidoreductase [Dankookia rubra]TDH60566.1 LLM class flavin-dependent oxidoreductase [Dankookia rubra]
MAAPRIGYLLPTRERVMEGRHDTGPLLALAERAEALGYDSIWVGDSLLARPRHDPMTLLAAVAARTRRVELGTAVLLPALRNPVLLAHQWATLDRLAEGRLILGVGIASDVPNIRDEFEAAGVPWDRRLGRMLEGLRLCRALWSGQPVDWDGRWRVRAGTLGPTPHRPGGPPIWVAGSAEPTIERVGRHFDGWFPNGPSPAQYAETWRAMQAAARTAGRDPGAITGAAYLTLAVDEDAARANARLDRFMAGYYGQRPDTIRKRQACFAGPLAGARDWLAAYAAAGVSHFTLRFAGDHERHLELLAGIGAGLAAPAPAG